MVGLIDLGWWTTVALLWFSPSGEASRTFAASLLHPGRVKLDCLTLDLPPAGSVHDVFLFFFPATLPGFMFPISSMPAAIQLITLINPIRYFPDSAPFLKGAGRNPVPQARGAGRYATVLLYWSIGLRKKIG
jgi:ABC-2 type transport system permease protein